MVLQEDNVLPALLQKLVGDFLFLAGKFRKFSGKFGGNFVGFSDPQNKGQRIAKGAGKKVPRENCRKVLKNFLTLFDDFGPARKLSKSVEKLFDIF